MKKKTSNAQRKEAIEMILCNLNEFHEWTDKQRKLYNDLEEEYSEILTDERNEKELG